MNIVYSEGVSIYSLTLLQIVRVALRHSLSVPYGLHHPNSKGLTPQPSRKESDCMQHVKPLFLEPLVQYKGETV